eukprot:scaffold1048_cov90-Amphora_coffeaeformis.AAC.34
MDEQTKHTPIKGYTDGRSDEKYNYVGCGTKCTRYNHFGQRTDAKYESAHNVVVVGKKFSDS